MLQAAPGAFQLLKPLVMKDLVDLLRELGVDLGDHRLDRADHVIGHHRALTQGLLDKRTYSAFDLGACPIRLRLDLPYQHSGKVIQRSYVGLR